MLIPLRLKTAGLILAVGIVLGLSSSGFATDSEKLSGPSQMTTTVPASPMPQEVTNDHRKARNYPEQPPLIPHTIRDYQIDKNFNKCMTCHDRRYSEMVQAPMVSISHYLDRDGNTLATISPRRYFCTQCHVTQMDVDPLEANTFKDADSLLAPADSRRK